MQHTIKISVNNSQTGIPQSNDGIFGLFVKALAVGTFALDTPYLITKLADAEALGLTAANDATSGIAVHQQLSEFYAEAGSGTLLWLFGVAKATTFAAYVAGNTFDNVIRYTAQADPNQRVKMIGLCYEVPAATQSAGDFPADVTATLAALQTKLDFLFNAGFQLSAILDGYNMSSTVTPATLGTMATEDTASISLCITGSLPNGVSSVGEALGKYSRMGLGASIGEVGAGAVTLQSAYLTNGVTILPTGALEVGKTYMVLGGNITYNTATINKGSTFVPVVGHTTYTTTAGGYCVTGGTPVANLTPSTADGTGEVDVLGSKQYLFLRTWFNHKGFYWNDGATCTDPTLVLALQENNRIANALSANALSFFIDKIGQQFPLDVKTGNIDQNALNALQQQFYEKYIEPLNTASGSGAITDGSIVVTGVNFNATKTLDFTITIVSAPALGGVTGTITFSSTL